MYVQLIVHCAGKFWIHFSLTSSRFRSKGSQAAIPKTVSIVELTAKSRVVMVSIMHSRWRSKQSMMRPVGFDLKSKQVEAYIA